ncbi:hypothetical protein GCM10022252_09730 [Streptosporangium oxazolinicum]|uniref:Alcohol dehydrogenase N-terminal domain-containing protein n=1 Tax=Streptosporangium oxazolinicum TaxID=909287 RepID=A0ABP8AF60_9ACTN
MMMVYRLAQRGSIDHLTLREEAMPWPQRGEVVVRVRAVSLNYRDLALVHGRYFPDAPLRQRRGRGQDRHQPVGTAMPYPSSRRAARRRPAESASADWFGS